MLKLVAKSKRGRQQIQRHGNIWLPIRGGRQIGCLGGVPGIELKSMRDGATFWIKVENDDNLIPVERLDNFGRPIPRKVETAPPELLPAEFSNEQQIDNAYPQRSILEPPKLTAMQKTEYQVIGATSGRTSASGEPNQSAIGHSADEKPEDT